METAVDVLRAEIEKREEQMKLLADEVAALRRSLEIIAPDDRESSFTQAWQARAMSLMGDFQKHQLKDIAATAHEATPDVPLERVRKSVHMWLARRVVRGEVLKGGHGEYQLRKLAAQDS